MTCPSSEELLRCLEGDPSGIEPNLGDHISRCPHCQQRLNSLSEDPQLAAWRDADQQLQSSISDEDGCRSVIEQACITPLTDQFESAETITTDELRLEPPAVEGDLGRLGNYRIIRRLGQGGMAVVFEAVDLRLRRTVALKVLRPDRLTRRARERFVREAQALAKIKHPNVVDIYDVADPDCGPPYFVTELMQGTLRSLIQRGPLGSRQAAELIAAVADGLQSAHDAGLVHRDIKPSNILLGRAADGVRWVPKLSDFGLAKPLETSTQTTLTIGLSGTPAYMSPEQIKDPNSVTIATDVYSLGVTLYESLCNELPFRGPPHAVLNQIAEDEAPRPSRFNPHVPRELELICVKAMSREQQNRYSTSEALAADLRNWLAGRPIMAKPIGSLATFTRWCRRNRRVAALSFTVAGLMCLLTVGSLTAALVIWSSQAALRERTTAAESARTAAQRAQAAADAATAQAVRQRRITLDTLNNLVGNVQTQLETRPETGQLRQSLLTKAFEGLESVAEALENEQEVDRTMIDAHIKMAAIKLEFGDTKSAVEQSGNAIALAERALAKAAEEAPEDASLLVETLRDVANALTTEFEIHFRAFSYDSALRTAERIVEIRRRVCSLAPKDPVAARALIAIRQRIADIQLKTGKVTQAAESFSRLSKEIDELQTQAGDAIDLRRDKNVMLNRLGSLRMMLGDMVQAESLFMSSLQIVTEQLHQDPGNTIHRTDLAFTKSRIAQLKSKLGLLDEAVSSAEETAAVYRQLAEAEPNNVQYRTLLGASYDMLYQIQFAAGELRRAREAEMQSFRISLENCYRDPSTARYPLMAIETAVKIGDTFLRDGQLKEAIEWFQKSIELIERGKKCTDYSSDVMQPVEATVKELLAACQLAEQGEIACREALGSNPGTAFSSLATLAYLDAVQRKSENYAIRIKELRSLEPKNAISVISEVLWIRTLGRVHQTSEESAKGELEDQIIALTKICIEHRPTLKQDFASDPDFSSMRAIPAFRELLQ